MLFFFFFVDQRGDGIEAVFPCPISASHCCVSTYYSYVCSRLHTVKGVQTPNRSEWNVPFGFGIWMERNDDDLPFLSGDESERSTSERTSKERHIHGELLLIQRSARAQKPEAEAKQKQRAVEKKKKEAPQRGRGDYYLGTRGAVRKFPKSTWAGPSRAPSASCFSLRFRFLRLQAPLLRSAVGTGRTACRPRRRHRRRRRAMRSRRRRPSGAARASTTSTRSFSARSGAAPQRFV